MRRCLQVAIPRLGKPASAAALSPPKRAKNLKYKVLQPKPEPPCDISGYNVRQPAAANTRSQAPNANDSCDKGSEPVPAIPLSRERLISIGNMDKDALDDYLGTNNSQVCLCRLHRTGSVKDFFNWRNCLLKNSTVIAQFQI